MRFNKTILASGLRVITVPMADNPSVTVLVLVEAGSKYEAKSENGISHFLEHLTFKGTTKRPQAIDISREFDAMGAEHNAFTSQEYTGYYGKAAAERCDGLLDILSDMYKDPLIDPAEMEKEKGVVIEEIRMYNDQPRAVVSYLFDELLYGDQPAGWKVIGTEENVRSFTRDMVMRYRTDHYKSGGTVVIVSGSFDEKSIVKKIEESFKGISVGQGKPKQPVVERQSSPQAKSLFKDTNQTHLVIGVRTFPAKDERMPAMRVLTAVLGAGMSSRLFSRMRNELGICYYIEASHDASTDHGELSISAGVDNSRVKEGVTEILAQCKKLKDELIPEQELKKVKDYIAGRTRLNLETSDARADFFGHREILRKETESPEDALKRVYIVTAEDVRRLAREIFVDESLNMAVVGKHKDASVFMEYLTFS